MMASLVRENVAGYIEYRARRGYTHVSSKTTIFKAFERFLSERKIESSSQIDSSFVLAFTKELLRSKEPQTVSAYVGTLDDFFRYLQRMDLIEHNPFEDRVGLPRRLSFCPYIFSDEEVHRLLRSYADDVNRCNYMRSFRYRLSHLCMMTIMAHCGLRASEACKLRLEDLSFTERTLYIEKTKFRKDRKIPVSAHVMGEIRNYLEVRKLHPESAKTNFLFFGPKGTHFRSNDLERRFHRKVCELGIWRAPFVRGETKFGSPTSHALRHAFAVRTIRRWQALGLSIDQIADTLATYMGHAEFRSTQIYLKALSRNPGTLVFDYARRRH